MLTTVLIMTYAITTAQTAASAPFEAIEVAPRDEAGQDSSLKSFLDKLQKTIEKRDVLGLLKVVDPNIKCGFGGDDGGKAFVNQWALQAKPKESPIWKELGTILDLGGEFGEKTEKGNRPFYAPYTFTAFPDSLDSFEYGLVTGAGVRVRSTPSSKGDPIEKVSYIAVRMLQQADREEETIDGETYPWQKVGLPDGREGYIWGKYVRSPIDLRAGFSKESGEWKMVFLVAGD